MDPITIVRCMFEEVHIVDHINKLVVLREWYQLKRYVNRCCLVSAYISGQQMDVYAMFGYVLCQLSNLFVHNIILISVGLIFDFYVNHKQEKNFGLDLCNHQYEET